MNDVVRGFWASAYFNGDFICVLTRSGYRGGTETDFQAGKKLLDAEANDGILGAAVCEALERSRFVLAAPREGSAYPIDLEFDGDLYDPKKGAERYEEWRRDLMERYDYKTAKALFKSMYHCTIERRGDQIKMCPSRHEKLEAWGRTKGDGIEDVVIPANSTPAEIGAALRLAFSRCLD